jgi:hypothetical protein
MLYQIFETNHSANEGVAPLTQARKGENPMTDIESLKLYQAIAAKLNLSDSSDVDGDEFAEKFTLQELVILQKEITKAIQRKVMN